MGNKVMVIGLDGGTFSLLEPLARRGVMPGLAGLMEDGAWGVLRSTVPPVTAPAWTSFITGRNPGGHGIYQFFSFNPLSEDFLGMGEKSYLAVPGIVVNSERIPGEKLWSMIDRGGRRQLLINVPMTFPPERVNGLMITGMLTPPGSREMTYPPELAGELNDYEIDLDPGEKDFSGDDSHFLSRVEELTDKRLRWSLKLMKEHPWEFFMVVFTETDRLQHRFYDVVASLAGVGPDPEPARMDLHPRLEKLYRKLDEGITLLAEAAGRETRLILLSDHGFGPAPVKLLDLRVLKAHLGLGASGGSWAGGFPSSRWKKLKPTKARFYRYLGFLPQGWLRRVEAAFWRRKAVKDKIRLFKMHENIGGVWITSRDREGRVLEAKEHARLVESIRGRLAALEWEGAGFMESVVTREELYHGPYLDRAPDLIFTLEEDYGILEPGGVSAPGEMVVQAPADRPRKKGTHRGQGMFLLKGEGIRAGKLEDGAEIADMTATALYLLDLPLPGELDGKIPAGAFEEAFTRENPIRRGPTGTEEPREKQRPFSEKEEAAVIERLRGIGYFD